ncbi:ProQ/FinO family protein [Methylophilus sp. 'Pure River']|jgi:ProP effector|uniref:ProQ/FinO family protein n=1 Tax=Methylophilus sp. 'Pure River' TaxID=3377117 RepID=UPI00398EDF83
MGLEKLADLKKQLSAEAKSAKPTRSQKTASVDPVVLIIGKLQKLFPKTFPKNPNPKVPLKVGILDDLYARSEEIGISKEDIQLAIKTWCKSSRYWNASKEGAVRVDLDGNPAGVVEAKGAAQARAMARKAKPARIEASKPTTDSPKSEIE